MRTNKNLLAAAAGLVACIVVVWFSTSIQGVESIYEIRPQVGVPYGYTPTIDTSRIIDAYERLVERYMDLTERNLGRIGMNVKDVAKKLDSIDGKLRELSIRMSRIEKALGIEQPEEAAGDSSSPSPLQKGKPQ